MNSLSHYNEFDLKGLFQQAFGYGPPPNYKIPKSTAVTQPPGSNDFNIPALVTDEKISNRGTKLYDKDVFGREYFLPVTIGGVSLPFPVLSIEKEKLIVETDMVERRGSVNEIITIKDISVFIKGIIYRPDNTFPEEEIAQLDALFEQTGSLTIQSALTDIFFSGDDKVLIRKCGWVPVFGKVGYRPYELQLKSDLIFQLELA